jgi:acetoacetate decarboxylase
VKRSEEGYSMPLGSPAYGEPPYFGGTGIQPSELLLIEYECDPDAIAAETPEPLVPVDDRMVLWLGDPTLAPSNYAIYHEGALIHRVRYQDVVGGTVPYIWTESDEAMLVGRELYGFPKMICDPTRLRYDGANVSGEIARRGEWLIRAGLTLEAKASPAELPQVGPTFFFIRKFPSPEQGGKPLRQLVRIDQAFEVLECWRGRAVVELANAAQFRLRPLQPRRIVAGFFVKAKWILPHGRIVAEF